MLRAGAAQVDITPKCPLVLAGSFTKRVAERVHDPLLATALLVESDSAQLAIVSCDLLFMTDAQNDELRKSISEETGVPVGHVLLCCTHTHNGPGMFELLPPMPVDDDVVKNVKRGIVRAATDAVQNMQPARMGYASGNAERATFNRRFIMPDGRAVTNPGPNEPPAERLRAEGPADPEVQVVWFETPNREYIATLVNFSSHATEMFPVPEISADFPGIMRQVVTDVLGYMPVLYLQGACGNASPQNFEDQSEEAREQQALRTGRVLGGEVVKLLSGGRANREDPEIVVKTCTFESPIRDIPPERVEQARQELVDEPLNDTDLNDMSAVSRHYYNYWAVALTEGPNAQETYPVRLTVARLGDVVLACNCAELFAEYQLELKELSPYEHTLVAELTNGYCGYIPTRIALTLGSYEAWPALSSKLPAEAGDRLVSETVKILKEMRREEFLQEMEQTANTT